MRLGQYRASRSTRTLVAPCGALSTSLRTARAQAQLRVRGLALAKIALEIAALAPLHKAGISQPPYTAGQPPVNRRSGHFEPGKWVLQSVYELN
eukprot:116935-Rhodomonas_salina.2